MSEVAGNGWKVHQLYPWQRVTFRNGAACRDPVVMRRKAPEGHWEYRPMTSEEISEDNQDTAW